MKRLSELDATELLHIAQTKLPVAWELQLRYEPYRFVWGYDAGGDIWLNRVEGRTIEELLRAGLADIVEKQFGGDYTRIGSLSEESRRSRDVNSAPAFMTMQIRTKSLSGYPPHALLWRPYTGIHVPMVGSQVILLDDEMALGSKVSNVYLTEHDQTGIELLPLAFVLEGDAPVWDCGAWRSAKDVAQRDAMVEQALAVLGHRGWESLR